MTITPPDNSGRTKVKALVVDDSGFFRRRIVEILEADGRIQVVGTAANGQEAIDKTRELKPDVITMDIEMPVMDGITAVRRIMAIQPTPVLMFSSLSYDGAQATLDALEAGAIDFLPKRFDEITQDKEQAKRMLCAKVRAVGLQGLKTRTAPRPMAMANRAAPIPAAASVARIRKGDFKLLAIGSSTGGPVALQEVLAPLPADFKLPIILIQHMPGTFTPAFAARLNQMCQIKVKEAENGERLMPGTAYLAPGGKQLLVDQQGAQVCLKVIDGEPSLHYKPSVDVAFRSAAGVFPGKVLSIILTGMGADGREGARALKQGKSTVWAQDEATSTIYGMPAAVAEAGLTDQILPLQEIGQAIIKAV